MLTKLSTISLYVKDIDEAVAFYTEKLGFVKVMDEEMAPGVRAAKVAPNIDNQTVINFEIPKTDEERQLIGKQFPNMMVILETDTFDETYASLKNNGVEVVEEPTTAPWGKQAVIKDLYGNFFDLVEPPKQ